MNQKTKSKKKTLNYLLFQHWFNKTAKEPAVHLTKQLAKELPNHNIEASESEHIPIDHEYQKFVFSKNTQQLKKPPNLKAKAQ